MKKGFSIFILALMIFYVMQPVMPFLEYAINQKYIARVLCENKAKPKMQCNGKCHLMKELKKASQSDPAPKNEIQKTEKILEFINSSTLVFNSYISVSEIAIPAEVFYSDRVIISVPTPPPNV